MQTIKRESNLDLLRVLCCISVVILHISFRFKAGINNPNMVGSLITTNVPAILLLDTITRFTVPCFVVLADAFTLERKMQTTATITERPSGLSVFS